MLALFFLERRRELQRNYRGCALCARAKRLKYNEEKKRGEASKIMLETAKYYSTLQMPFSFYPQNFRDVKDCIGLW